MGGEGWRCWLMVLAHPSSPAAATPRAAEIACTATPRRPSWPKRIGRSNSPG